MFLIFSKASELCLFTIPSIFLLTITLTTIKQKAKEVWFVSNGLGIRKACNSKDEALKIAKEINKKIYEVCKIDI